MVFTIVILSEKFDFNMVYHTKYANRISICDELLTIKTKLELTCTLKRNGMTIKMMGGCQFKLIWIHFNIVTVSWYWTIIWVTFDSIQLLMIYLYLVYRWMRGLCNICSCLIDVVSFCFWSFSIMYRIKFINLCHHIIQNKRNIWIWGSICYY